MGWVELVVSVATAAVEKGLGVQDQPYSERMREGEVWWGILPSTVPMPCTVATNPPGKRSENAPEGGIEVDVEHVAGRKPELLGARWGELCRLREHVPCVTNLWREG
jgi:hypothetical protein